ncbi:serine hydrolase domain-containing protein [Geodermatophilus ruber]|uniref:D-alanyl-D-alanine carboxypeptidase n=1 Tax=Geodermatophilus ruber TaxID=504800 RepID=A0A1I4K551_9ACTN|nr:serine hydrolase domain-containing protein [Geodermatophilus ruber]SFL73727.1 D-alanyl-D-alanine carboxypeptidase [Geodermatophilus ruber]
MTERRDRSLPIRDAWARTLLAALLLLAGLVAPQVETAPASAAIDDDVLRSELRADLQAHLQARGVAEHVSAAGLSVSLPDRRESIDVSAGTTTFGGSEQVHPSSVWQIGSNTKAFTSVLLLQLEAEGRLSIDDPLGRWLPQYPQWRDVSIRRLLNMTSGIPTYDDQAAFLADYAADPQTYFSAERLAGYAVGAAATSGYSYSNTNYVLAEMLIERVTGESYRHELEQRLIEPLGLEDLYYREHRYPSSVTRREPAGYFADAGEPALAGLVGRDVSRDTLSWARGAGGILSTTSDMTRWERALYAGRLLPAAQQAELTSLVSTATGQPIERTSASDPTGFGLGVAQLTAEPIGTFWFYEGETLGFRTLHVFLPDSDVIIAMGLNSHPADDQDQIGDLAVAVYRTLVAQQVIAVPAGAGA